MNLVHRQTAWGVIFTNIIGSRLLVQDFWYLNRVKNQHEPERILLFKTRQAARDWCKEQSSIAFALSQKQRYVPVRVRETVEVIK